MKKSLGLLILTTVLLTSCQTVIKTSRTANVGSQLQSATVVDLEAADKRVTYTLRPNKEVQRGGFENVKRAAEADVLKEHNADVLLEPRYVVSEKRTLFGKKIESVTVSGRPAYYKNYRSLSDSVWSNPVFRGVKTKANRTTKNGVAKKNTTHSSLFRKRGFEGYVSIAPSYSWYDRFDRYGDCDRVSENSLNILANYGYRFNSHFFAGIGTGLMRGDYDGGYDYSFPIYLDARVDFFKTKNTLFAEFMAGTYFCYGYGETEGLFFGFSLGYSIGNLDLSIRYLRQHEYPFENDYDKNYEECLQSIGLSLGYRF